VAQKPAAAAPRVTAAVLASLVADAQAPKLAQPAQRAFDDPAVLSQAAAGGPGEKTRPLAPARSPPPRGVTRLSPWPPARPGPWNLRDRPRPLTTPPGSSSLARSMFR
jgi:hypothetical protein